MKPLRLCLPYAAPDGENRTVKKTLFSSVCCLLALILLLSPAAVAATSEEPVSSEDIHACAMGIIQWKKSDVGAEPDGKLLCDAFLRYAGTTPGDWFPIGLGRLGVSDDYDAYLAVLRNKVEQRYCQKGKLSVAKATEWHRISLAVLACGGDPTAFGTDENGQAINLIADGTYDRGKTVSLGKQGINGWIWGLIALDSLRYEIPEDAFYSRDDIICEILRRQLPDGGFALYGNAGDPDITAMAVQALSPYYNNEKQYKYVTSGTKETKAATVRQIIDEALACLSALQTSDGDFVSWGTKNAESTAQVLVALCSLGIDPLTDSRFVKDGHTLYDGILGYRMPDGGFLHSYTVDPDNPSSRPDASNSMASEQVLYALAALYRQQKGMRFLYDMREEMSDVMKERVRTVSDGAAQVTDETDSETLVSLLRLFYALPENERCYVKGYWNISDAAKNRGIDIEDIVGTTEVVEDKTDPAQDEVLLWFSESDKAEVLSLPPKPPVSCYSTVLRLTDKLEKSEDFDEKEQYRKRLADARTTIEITQAEIDALNREIREKIYPLEGLTLSDRKAVTALYDRCLALSEEDLALVTHFDDVIRAKAAVDTSARTLTIGISVGAAALAVAALLFFGIRRKITKKKRGMAELESFYEREDG